MLGLNAGYSHGWPKKIQKKKKKKGVGKREREKEGKRTKTKTHHQTVITNQISIPYFWRGGSI